MADRYLYGSVTSPSAGENIRRQLANADHALIAGLKYGSGTVELTSAGAVQVLPATGQDLTLKSNGAGSILADLNSVSSNEGFDIDFTTTGSSYFRLRSDGSELDLTSRIDRLTYRAIGSVVIEADTDGGASDTLDLQVNGASRFLGGVTDTTIKSGGGGDLHLHFDVGSPGTGEFNIFQDGTAVRMNISTVGQITFTPVSGQNFEVSTGGAGDIDLNSTDAITLDAGGASNFTVAGSSLTLSTTTSGNIVVDAAGAVTIDGTGVSIDGTSGSNFTVTAANRSLSLEALGGGANQVILNSAGTGADALRLYASAGGLDVDIAAAVSLNYDTTGSGSIFELLRNGNGVLEVDASGNATLDSYNAVAATNIETAIRATNVGATSGDATVVLRADSTNGTAIVGVNIDGSPTVAFYGDRNESTEPWHLGSGSISEPSYSFGAATTTGMYYLTVSGSPACGFAASGAEAAQILGRGILLEAEGSAAAPAYSFSDYPTTGLYWAMFASAEGLGITTGGTVRVSVSSGVFSVQDVGNIDIDSDGGISLDANGGVLTATATGSMTLTYDSDDTGDTAAIKRTSANTLVAFSSTGGVAVTPESGANFTANTTGDAWSEIDGTYYVPPGNGLEQLLSYLIVTATSGATIMLGMGSYTITWTTATSINQSIHIIGISSADTEIRFTQDDADNYFSIAAPSHIENVKFTGAGWSATPPSYAINFSSGAAGSIVENCEFDVSGASAGVIYVASGCDEVVIRNNNFSSTPSGSGTAVITSAGADQIRVLDNYSASCDAQFFFRIPDATTTYGPIVRSNRVTGASGAASTAKIYLGSAARQGVIEENYLDYTSSAADTFISLGGSGSGSGNIGNHRFIGNQIRCERSTSTSWSSGVNMMEVTTPRNIVSNNQFYLRYIGYSNTQQGSVLAIDQYDNVVEGNIFIAWDCRTCIEIVGGPTRCRIVNNSMTDMDHDGTGNGYGIYFNLGTSQLEGVTIIGNIFTATSAAEHTSIDSSDGTGTYYVRHAVVMGNIQQTVATIPVAKFLYSTFLGNVNRSVSSTAGTSISGTNASNVYGDDDETGNPSTSAPGANQ